MGSRNQYKVASKQRRRSGAIAPVMWLTLACFGMLVLTGYAADPGWWTSRGAVTPSSSPAPYAVVNQGQLKAFTVKAVQELNAGLASSGGAGSALNNLVSGWQQDYATNGYATNPANPTRPYKPADFEAVRVGQLKYIASLIYSRLHAVNYPGPYPTWITSNPSTDGTLAVLGQLKTVFNFDLNTALDPDGSGLPIAWEELYFGHLGIDPNALAPNGSGLTILQAYQQGVNPIGTADTSPPVLSIVSGNAQSGEPGTQLGQQLVVRVLDTSAMPIANAQVTFQISADGGGSLAMAGNTSSFAGILTLQTSNTGIASAVLQLNSNATGHCAVKVSSSRNVANASPSNSVQFIATILHNVSAPAAPTDLQYSVLANGAVQLQWLEVSSGHATGFVVERRASSGSWQSIGNSTANSTSFTDSSPTGHPCFYRVIATNPQGETASDPIFCGQGPAVIIISPVNGQQTTTNGKFTLTALALDSSATISKVEFFDGVNKLGEADASPYTTAWQNISSGSHTITAVATDTNGAKATSDPVTISAIMFPFIAAGGDQSFALQADGTLWAWGNNFDGELGAGTDGNSYLLPNKIADTTGTQSVAAGTSHTLILNADGTVSAFGSNGDNELGLGNSDEQTMPVLVLGLTGVIAVAAGDSISAALTTDGKVWTWGFNQSPTPTQVNSLTNVIAIATGDAHFLALKADHTVWSWGDNSAGQLGIGNTESQAVPVQVTGITDVTALAAGISYSAAKTSSGQVYTWGDNSCGQLGNGTTAPSFSPVLVQGLPAADKIATRGSHTLVLSTSGAVWAFGNNAYGQIGDSSNVNHDSPVQIGGLPTIVQIAAGANHSIALSTDGQIFTWGGNYDGQLGTNDVTGASSTAPGGIGSLHSTPSLTSSGGQGTPDPGGGGLGPQLDPDHDNQVQGSFPIDLHVAPAEETDPVTHHSRKVTSTADLTWRNMGRETLQTITIQRRDGSSDWKNIGNVAANALEYKDPSLFAFVAYEYRILATYTTGRALFSYAVPYNVPFATGLSVKISSGKTQKSDWAAHEFLTATPPAIPTYYLTENTTENFTYEHPGAPSTYSTKVYTVSNDPVQHIRKGNSEIDATEYTVKFDSEMDELSPQRTTSLWTATYSKIYDDDDYFKADSSAASAYHARNGAPLWEGTGYSSSLGDLIYSGTYKSKTPDWYYNADGTIANGIRAIDLTLDSNGYNWTGTVTNADGSEFPYSMHYYDTYGYGFDDLHFLSGMGYHVICSDPAEYDESHKDYSLSDTLTDVYTTESFIQHSINDIPDYPAEFTTNYTPLDFREVADPSPLEPNGNYGGSTGWLLASRKLSKSQETLDIDRVIYKIQTNSANEVSFPVYEIFVPDPTSDTTNLSASATIIDTFSLTGSPTSNAVEHEVDPCSMPDVFTTEGRNGKYYLVPGFRVLASGNISDPSSTTGMDTVAELDPQQEAAGSAILTPPNGASSDAVTGHISIPLISSSSIFSSVANVDPASISFTLTWTNPNDVTVHDEISNNPITIGKQFSEADIMSRAAGINYTISANASAHDGEQIAFTIKRFLNGKAFGQETVLYTVRLYKPLHDYSVPFDEASGARYRKLALNGRPMPDEKPQKTAETDQEKEQTYIDALSLGLHHSTTDIYVPVANSDLALSARRETLSEVWNMRNGIRPHERLDRPFGAGWATNLVPSVDAVTKDNNTIYYVTDQNGYVHRYFWADAAIVPLPSDQRENSDYLTSFDGSTFTDRFGTRTNFVSADIFRSIAGDRTAISANETHAYYRVSSVIDRLGNRLDYNYPPDVFTLIPSTITSNHHPDQTLYIRQDAEGHITDTWDPNGNHFQYIYQKTDPYTYGGQSYQETTLYSVVGPDGKSTCYKYDFAREPDQTPISISQGFPVDHLHIDVSEITNPLSNTTSFTYQFDQSKFGYDPAQDGYYKETGAPRNVVSVSLPGIAGTPHFDNQSDVRLQLDLSGHPSVDASTRKNQITDADGNICTYSFTGSHVFDVIGLYPGLPVWAVPKIVFYTTMTIDYSGIGSETFKFDATAGLALASAKDLCGNTTSYDYADQRLTVGFDNNIDFSQFFPYPNFAGYFEDPTRQTNAVTVAKTFTYALGSWHLLSDVIDEEGRTTHFEFDGLGRRTEEDINDGATTVVQKTTFDYDTTFPSFVKLRTVHKLGLTSDPSTWGGDFVTQYVPDHAGRIAKQIADPYGLSLTTSYTYDSNGNKLSETDPRQHTTYFTYDVRNRLEYVNYSDGTQRHYVYDANGNKTQELDENHHATIFEYDNANRLKRQARDMNGNGQIDPGIDLITAYTYNDVNSLETTTNPNGNVTTNHHDALQRVYQVDHPLIPPTLYQYDLTKNCGGSVFDSSSFKPTQITDPAGYVTYIQYDALYRPQITSRQYQLPTTLGSPLFASTTTSFDNVGNLRFTTDARAHTTETRYDALNRPYYVGYPDGKYTQTTYSSTGLKWQTQDECLQVTQTKYDGAGRLTDVYAPAVFDSVSQQTVSPHTQTLHDANGNISGIINPRGYETDFTFDARNRQTDEFSPPVFDADSGLTLRAHTHTEHDGVGNRLSVTDPRGNITLYEPDDANRVVRVTGPPVPIDGDSAGYASPITQTTYDFNGNVRTVLDGNAHVTTNFYDALDRLQITVNPQQEATRYDYDNLGNRTLISAGLKAGNMANGPPALTLGSNPQTTTLTYDGLNRNTSTAYPSGAVSSTYDGVVKLSRQDGNGRVTNYDLYDPRYRLKHVSYPAHPSDNRTYDYDDAGRILAVTEAHGGVTDVAYTYDALGRTQSETSNGVTHTYLYDLAGNRTSAQYGTLSTGSGRLLLSNYDTCNRLMTLADGTHTTAYQYDLGGHVRHKLLPDGETESTSYDALGRQSDSSDAGGSGGSLIYAYNYGYDAGGNLTLMSEYKAGMATRCTTMSYFPSDRLETEWVHAGADVTGPLLTSTTYGYDEMGNRTSRQVAGGLLTTYSYNGAGQLEEFSDPSGYDVHFSYDGNGNRATRTQGTATDVYTYDTENELVGLSKGGKQYVYLYDYRTRRVQRTEGSISTQVIFSGGTSVQEYPMGGTGTTPVPPSVEFIRGSDWGGGVGGILYSVHGGGSPSFDHYDGRGDVATQTNGVGTVTYQANYEAWGTRAYEFGSNDDRQRANTKEEDPTGLLNEGMRYRDLEAGCFTTRDPAGFVDGPNLYAYVNQNPWTKFDPEGLAGYGDMMRWAENQSAEGNNLAAYGAVFAATAWNTFSFGSAAKNDAAAESYNRGEISGGQLAGQMTLNTATAVAKGAVVYGTGGLAAGASVPTAMAVGAAGGATTEALDVANDRGNAAVAGQEYQGTIAGDAAKIARGAGTGAVLAGGGVLAADTAQAFNAGLGSSAKAASAQAAQEVVQATQEEAKPFVPDEYWQRYAPEQVTPGTRRLDFTRESGRTGRVEDSRVIYDEFGRQKYRVDKTDHMRPESHSNPHLHEYEYHPTPQNPSVTETRHNF